MWKRNSWNLGVIFIFFTLSFIFSLGNVSAQNITIEYPSEVNVNEEFNVSLELVNFSEGTYDVKIDITSKSERIGQIYNDEENKYKSTYYFVKDILNSSESKNFKMKIIKEYEGEADIIVKIRNSKGKSESFEGDIINVNKEIIENNTKEEAIGSSVEKINENNASEKNINKEKINEDENNNGNNETPKETKLDNLSENHDENKVIYLTPQSIKNHENKEVVFKSNNEKTKNYAIYGFAVFCVLVIVLLILDRRR